MSCRNSSFFGGGSIIVNNYRVTPSDSFAPESCLKYIENKRLLMGFAMAHDTFGPGMDCHKGLIIANEPQEAY